MAPIDRRLRLRLWAWVVRRQGSIADRSEADVIALQGRRVPDNAVINFVLGTTRAGTEVSDQVIPGPASSISPACAGSRPRPWPRSAPSRQPR
jgi:hypothetical protein